MKSLSALVCSENLESKGKKLHPEVIPGNAEVSLKSEFAFLDTLFFSI